MSGPIIKKVRGFTPKISESTWLAENVTVIGDVEVGDRSSLWYNVVIRGDVMPIRIGHEVNVQDGSVLHGTYGKYGCTLHDRVTIGHLVMLHGCEIGSSTLIGMGSIVMDGAKIGANCLVGAGSLVTEGSVFPDGQLIVGRPAKVKRPLTESEIDLLSKSADNYLLYTSWYQEAENKS